MPNAWVNERKREYYYRKAKKENFRSRASYKLLQATKKYNFIKPGYVVVDLGAAPGGWAQVAGNLVEYSGFVLAIDMKPITNFNQTNIRTVIGDITDSQIFNIIKEFLPRPADVVISDVSPNVSGIWELDHARQIDLATQSLHISTKILRSGGNFFVKGFQGGTLNKFVKEVKKNFHFVKMVKPKASRMKSAELYVLGMNFKQKSDPVIQT
ncbi:RlmE family RNA methyltransferase [Candidatus Bathyarchaeota archaeon]|nr:RlmE family RNA methyltransferase [Candidatus Bathyarchaeota archaeon]